MDEGQAVTATAILDLERAGFTREQVEALARWHEAGIDLSHLATKADLAEVRREIADAEAGRFDRRQAHGQLLDASLDPAQAAVLIGDLLQRLAARQAGGGP